MEKKLQLLGIVSIILGVAAALLCLLPWGFLTALPVGFTGMLCSVIYIFIDTRYEINTKKITPGIIGVILSSVPVLLILILNFRHLF